MTHFIVIDGKIITMEEALKNYLERKRIEDEQRRKSFDDFGEYLR